MLVNLTLIWRACARTCGRMLLTAANASSSVSGLLQMRYATTAAADLLIPCMQCTNTCIPGKVPRPRQLLSHDSLLVSRTTATISA
eukprot:1348438-Pyramimonas_sp.AAC.1